MRWWKAVKKTKTKKTETPTFFRGLWVERRGPLRLLTFSLRRAISCFTQRLKRGPYVSRGECQHQNRPYSYGQSGTYLARHHVPSKKRHKTTTSTKTVLSPTTGTEWVVRETIGTFEKRHNMNTNNEAVHRVSESVSE